MPDGTDRAKPWRYQAGRYQPFWDQAWRDQPWRDQPGRYQHWRDQHWRDQPSVVADGTPNPLCRFLVHRPGPACARLSASAPGLAGQSQPLPVPRQWTGTNPRMKPAAWEPSDHPYGVQPVARKAVGTRYRQTAVPDPGSDWLWATSRRWLSGCAPGSMCMASFVPRPERPIVPEVRRRRQSGAVFDIILDKGRQICSMFVHDHCVSHRCATR
jgi:hypothetical protein